MGRAYLWGYPLRATLFLSRYRIISLCCTAPTFYGVRLNLSLLALMGMAVTLIAISNTFRFPYPDHEISSFSADCIGAARVFI